MRPKWAELMPWILDTIENPRVGDNVKKALRQELCDLARKVDECIRSTEVEAGSIKKDVLS